MTTNRTSHGSMTMFVWKEARENWKSIAMGPALIVAILAAASVYNVTHRTSPATEVFDSSTTIWMLYALWMLSAVLFSSSMMAPEVGSGTVQFLSSLPISRKRIWWTKLAAGFVAWLLFVGVTTLAYVALLAAHIPITHYTPFARDFHAAGRIVLLLAVPVYAVGCFVSMLVDRTVTALAATVIASTVLATLTMAASNPSEYAIHGVNLGIVGIGVLIVPVCLSMSYETFLRGETLKTSNRFKVAIPGLLIDLAIVSAAVVAALLWIVS